MKSERRNELKRKKKWIVIIVLVVAVMVASISFISPIIAQKEAIRHCKITCVEIHTVKHEIPGTDFIDFTSKFTITIYNPTNTEITLSRVDLDKWENMTELGTYQAGTIRWVTIGSGVRGQILQKKITIPPQSSREVTIVSDQWAGWDRIIYLSNSNTIVCTVYIETPLGAIKGGEIYG